MRQLRELRTISYLFIIVTLFFILLLLSELALLGGDLALSFDDVNSVNMDYHLITCFSIIAYSYNVQFLVFPAYMELKNRSNERFNKANLLSIVIGSLAYFMTGFIAILLFGP